MEIQSLFRPDAAAKYLKDRTGFGSVRSLAKSRVYGTGPAFRRLGGRAIVYEKSALDAWIADRLSAPRLSTSEAA
ncbi:helix-turn-helix transcriptional regulator [Methylosinus sporium]|uniref:helix-turn-helix transcriptional regulator n=1 Tax=Methylosinus sporium TaxID=428 RepID=UPI00383BD899